METKAAHTACIPADEPLLARAERWSSSRSLAGAPRVCIEPFEVRLPTLTLDLGRIVVRLPKVRVYTCVRLPGDGGPAGSGPSEDALRRLMSDAAWSESQVEVEAPSVSVTPVRVHAIPSTDAILPICWQIDLDSVVVSVEVGPLESRVHGCIVGNGPLAQCACAPGPTPASGSSR